MPNPDRSRADDNSSPYASLQLLCMGSNTACVCCVGKPSVFGMAAFWARTNWQLHTLYRRQSVQVYDEEGVDRTPKQLAQRQMVPVRPPPQAALPGLLPGRARVPGGSILGRHHRESRMSSRVSKLSKHSPVP